MKSKFLTTVLSAILGISCLMLTARDQHMMAPALVQANDRGVCSQRDLAGRWGYTYSGTIVGLGPAGSVGSFSIDERGNLSGSQTRSFNGDVEPETTTGNISIQHDCTATGTITVYLNGVFERSTDLDLVFVDHERGARASFKTPGTVITIEARRIDED
ncbi:MAG TPA: hypothetical protein VMH00_11225 [Candidatus Limnocylindrales bacterium]|nr:hypothetical protein [Candidatus Limnocylindrales bacterium]